MAADDPPHRGITAQTVGVVHVIIPAKTAKHRLAELPDHAMPSVLAGTAVLEKIPGNPGQAKGIVKLPIGEKSSGGSDLPRRNARECSALERPARRSTTYPCTPMPAGWHGSGGAVKSTATDGGGVEGLTAILVQAKPSIWQEYRAVCRARRHSLCNLSGRAC